MKSGNRSRPESADPPDAAGKAGAAMAPAAESFETAVAELDDLVHKMEGGSLSLEQSLAAYKRGAELVQYCQKTLADVQQQVQILEAGLFKPFQDADDQANLEDNA